jgi:hypothetical protein
MARYDVGEILSLLLGSLSSRYFQDRPESR